MLHVAPPITQWAVDYVPDASVVKQAEAAEILRAKEMMQKGLLQFPEGQEIEVINDSREGDPVAHNLKEHDEAGVDLIVMPSHGKTGLLKLMMGLVSEKVMEDANTPHTL
ncbi:MAG: hypothetical protein CVU71_11405 [Deltaproteobacteria bacterium HGW-Deltaproteobacteria-6]|nr:MAG: hypothetical protein CVU71_11405 [Deltaproteobacteria bacterium HGW-Deltaproteobacteria-6]